MKTIKELRDEGRLSKRAYHALIKLVCWDLRWWSKSNFCGRVTASELDELTLKDVFELYDDRDLLRLRGVGAGVLSELKGLV